jgi:hypothetical protein
VPTLSEIAADPRLLRVIIDATDLRNLEPGETISVTPRIIKPEDVRAQMVPQTVQVIAVEQAE